MTLAIAILGSSAFGALISFVFTWLTNNKNNSLNYITDERRKWREKIREIVIGIEKSQFQGKGKKDLNQYLIQLQVSINPYGRTRKMDYGRDGHIWNIIEKIKNSHNEDEFLKNKKTLLEYLSLMLKKDWEKSKSEVRGYSTIVILVSIMLLNTLFYIVYYFYILKLENIVFFAIMIFFNFMPFIVIEFFLLDEINEIKNNRKRMSIKLLIKKEKKATKIAILFAISAGLVIMFNFFLSTYYYPKVISQNMSYCKENDTVFLYTNLDLNLLDNFTGNLQHDIKNKVIIVKDKSELPIKQERNNANDAILEKSIQISISFWNTITILLTVLIPVTGFYFSANLQMKTIDYLNEIDRIDFMNNCKSKIAYEQIIAFLEKINYCNGQAFL